MKNNRILKNLLSATSFFFLLSFLSAYDIDVDVSKGRNKCDASQEGREQKFTWRSAENTYKLLYRICTDKEILPKAAECVPGDWASLGLLSPTRFNWYSNGFIRLWIDGKCIDNYIANFKVLNGKHLEAEWNIPDTARIALDFFVNIDQPEPVLKIHGEITPYENKTPNSVRIQMLCFPNSYGIKENLKIATSERIINIKPQSRTKFNTGKENWLLYHDGNASKGGCAFEYNPSQITRVSVSCADGKSCLTELVCAPDIKSFDLSFWEFQKLSPSAARKYLSDPMSMDNASSSPKAGLDKLYLVQTDYFLNEKRALVFCEIAGNPREADSICVQLTDHNGNSLIKEKIKVNEARFNFPLDIQNLKQGNYKIHATLTDINGRKTLSKEALLRKIEKPFPDSEKATPYLQVLTFYTPRTLGEIDDKWIEAFNKTPYEGVAVRLANGFEIKPSIEYSSLSKPLEIIKEKSKKQIWPWIFFNRIYSYKNHDIERKKFSREQTAFFNRIRGVDLDDETGALSNLYDDFRLALKIARELKTPGIIVDPEAYNDHKLYSIKLLSEIRNESQETIKNKFRKIGERLAEIIRYEYPGACIWTLFFNSPSHADAITYIIYGLLDKGKKDNIPFKVIEGGESSISLGYTHGTIDSLKNRMKVRGGYYASMFLLYPERFYLGATISPINKYEDCSGWIKREYAGSGIKSVNDLRHNFEYIFSVYKYVWIYAAGTARFNPFSKDGIPYNKVIGEALKDVKEEKVEIKFNGKIQVPHLDIPKFSDGKPLIDGIADDAIWNNAVQLENFKGWQSGKPARFKTSVKIARDSENLYITACCYHPDMKKVIASLKRKEHDSKVWSDECFEIFFSPVSCPDKYFQIVINPAGTVLDACVITGDMDRKWESGIKVETSVQDDSWTLEAAIPLKNLDSDNHTKKWKFNVCREKRLDPEEFSCWSPTYGGFETVSNFGVLSLK